MPPITTTQGFAHFTITQRLPQVVRQVLADHDYPLEIREALEILQDELTHNDLVSPLNTNAPDGHAWAAQWEAYPGRRWWDLPWFWAEAFFYRRLLQASGYFGWPLVAVQLRPPTAASRAATEAWEGVDPFAPRKQAELQNPATWQQVTTALQLTAPHPADRLSQLLELALWGNRADLSYTQVAQHGAAPGDLLRDERGAVRAYLQQLTPPRHLSVISDNAGLELLLDLVLIDHLLRFEGVDSLTLHVKAHPTFVSDTTPVDVYQTVMALQEQPNAALNDLAERLQNYGARLQVKSDLFWNSPHFFSDLPDPLRHELAQTHLVIIKGDANYRRLLGDSLAWPAETPLAQVTAYFPAPFVTLRTLKSEAVVGLTPGQAAQLDLQDPTWRVNGQRGLIQAVGLTG